MHTARMGSCAMGMGKALPAALLRTHTPFALPLLMLQQMELAVLFAFEPPAATFKRAGMTSLVAMHQRMGSETPLHPERPATTGKGADKGLAAVAVMGTPVSSAVGGEGKACVATLAWAIIEPGFPVGCQTNCRALFALPTRRRSDTAGRAAPPTEGQQRTPGHGAGPPSEAGGKRRGGLRSCGTVVISFRQHGQQDSAAADDIVDRA